MIPAGVHLLPGNATPLEQALAATAARYQAVPVPIADLWNPKTCPPDLLAWLAWALSVDLWQETWPVEKKRHVIAESFTLHRLKGTLEGIRRHLEIVGAPLRKAIVPPDRAYCGRGWSAAARQAWLDQFPQIRVFTYRDRGVATHGAFCTGAYKLPKTYLVDGGALAFPYETDAWERTGRRPFLWDKGPHPLASGRETEMLSAARTVERRRKVMEGPEEFAIPTTASVQLFCDAPPSGNRNKTDGRRFPLDSLAGKRIVRVTVKREYIEENDRIVRTATLPPSLKPIDVVPTIRAEPGTMQRGINVWAGAQDDWITPDRQRRRIKGFVHGFVPETSAHLRLYDVLYLHDPARLPKTKATGVYLNAMRLGMPAYTAVLSPQVRGRRTLWQADRFVAGHVSQSSRAPLEQAMRAVTVSKSARDTVLLDTAIRRQLSTKHAIRSGDGYRSGGLITL